jgi:HK97 gp10 family phage protein
LTEFVLHLAAIEVAVKVQAHKGLERAALLVEKTAKAEIGHYQDAVGPFPAWAELAESTEAQKARMGYRAGAPLEASGAMRDDISHEIDGDEAAIGSPDDTMVYHEFGTSKMPPRPVLGPAVYRNKEKIQKILGQALVAGLMGGEVLEGGGDYFLGN